MAVTHPTATRDAIANAVAAIANTGATPFLAIHTAADVLLANIPLGVDFGASSGGTITATGASGANVVAVATGTASYGRINAAGGTEAFRGACGVGSGEVQISSLSISSGDTVTLTNNPTYTAPT
jgi:hypothetical protein